MRHLPLQPTFIWHTYLIIAIMGLLAARWFVPSLVACALLLGLDSRLRPPQRLILAAALFAAGFALAHAKFATAEKIITSHPAWTGRKDQRFCAKIRHVQGIPDNRLKIILEKAAGSGQPPLPGFCVWTWDKPAFMPLPGQTLCLSRAIRPAGGFANQKNSAWTASALARGFYWRVWSKGATGSPTVTGDPCFWAGARQYLLERFMACLEPRDGQPLSQARAILPALIFGDRFHIAQSSADNFAGAAIAHSLALSGQHLAVAGLLGACAIFLCARFRPGLYLRAPRAQLIILASLPLALLYLWLGNAPASLQRAAAMLFTGAVFLWRRRPFGGMDILCPALLLLLIFNPLAVFDIGLQLSALCVAIIILAWPALARLMRHRDRGAPTFPRRLQLGCAAVFLTSLVIQLALLPLNLIRFQQIGVWFPINIVWLPALGLIVLPLAVIALACAALPFTAATEAARLLLDAAALPCQALLDFLHYLDNASLLDNGAFLIPHWTALPAFALLAFALLARLFSPGSGKTRRLFALALIALACGPALRLWRGLDATPRITAVDIGQGEALLAELPGGMRLLFDGGGSFSSRFDPGRAILAPELAANSAPALTAVFNSHPDLDHLGGLFYILDNFRIGHIFHNGRDAQKSARDAWLRHKTRGNAHALATGQSMAIGGGMRLEVLHPPAHAPHWQGNSASLVLRLVKDGRGLALFTGDADRKAQEYLLHQGADIQADLVIAPHHGSDKDMLPAFYAAAKPKLVIACCGFYNFRNYPGRKLRKYLDTMGVPLLDTGSNGKITVEFTANGEIKAETVKGGGSPPPGATFLPAFLRRRTCRTWRRLPLFCAVHGAQPAFADPGPPSPCRPNPACALPHSWRAPGTWRQASAGRFPPPGRPRGRP